MPTNKFFPLGTQDEQNVLEDLIIESIQIKGVDFFYVPRSLGFVDKIFHEDRISKFKTAYPLEGYFDNVTQFDGDQSFLSKFGLQIEQQAQITIARRRWEELVGRFGQTILPNRPAEGDLLYFPLSRGLFEIKYVQYLNPFFQLGKLYVYKLNIELFQYASEHIETGIPEIDSIEITNTLDLGIIGSFHILGELGGSILEEDGSLILVEESTGFEDQAGNYPNNEDFRLAEDKIDFDPGNPFGEPLP